MVPNNFEVEGSTAQKSLWKLAKVTIMKEVRCLMKKVMLLKNIKLCMRQTSGATG